jgi:hypothetical protein
VADYADRPIVLSISPRPVDRRFFEAKRLPRGNKKAGECRLISAWKRLT